MVIPVSTVLRWRETAANFEGDVFTVMSSSEINPIS
jgi:hypothetical protein